MISPTRGAVRGKPHIPLLSREEIDSQVQQLRFKRFKKELADQTSSISPTHDTYFQLTPLEKPNELLDKQEEKPSSDKDAKENIAEQADDSYEYEYEWFTRSTAFAARFNQKSSKRLKLKQKQNKN
ncbi:MAG: hypothetical protein EZS28_040159 [Streblomastix strix]|uniref:Uncharacterized protein n=1 Tax=Streblomastix strix TaxID=222440 RepID=A0A5J4U1R0_9EUKA|nr:MAG: hypothetical protein EZS28_040159 [Streblomastix strix]